MPNNMYEALKEGINRETKVVTDVTTLEDAYETLYHLVSRLRDMDDFGDTILTHIYELNKQVDFPKAFEHVINNEYEFADYNYFKDSVTKYESDLVRILNDAISSDNPIKNWSDDINWLADHAVINLNGNDRTLEQLRQEIERRG